MSDFAHWDDQGSLLAPMPVTVRPASPRDLPEIVRLAPAVPMGLGDSGTAFQEVDDGPSTAFVAEADEGIVGWAKVTFHAQADGPAGSGYYLTGLGVTPAARRRRVGAALTAARLAWIGRRAAEAWYVAGMANPVSHALHDEFGFQEVARMARIHGVDFDGGEGVLFHADRAGWALM
jgi:ribosomal protein S18 acetylase RimI-like enzyme